MTRGGGASRGPASRAMGWGMGVPPPDQDETRMATPRDLKVQMAGETRARERAQALATQQTARAARAEAALAAMSAERDSWRERALAAEAEIASSRDRG